uniref:Armadillo repeat-containing protein n=1 Tax=Panagrolaimus davidi TaxID=227884 RepID=A0A914P103_9BILA
MYLENNDNCPDDEILQNDMVSILVKCFDSENLEIKKEVTNALGIFANGTEKQANMVIQYNAIPHFLDLLSSDKEELQRAAILAFMGIMGHGPKFRDYCIKTGLVEPLINLVEDSESSIDVLYDCAVMMYYICQEGNPIVPHETVVKILPALKTLIELKSDNEKSE